MTRYRKVPMRRPQRPRKRFRSPNRCTTPRTEKVATGGLVELTEAFWSQTMDDLMRDWEPNGMPYEDEFCENSMWPWEREYQ